MIQVHVGMNFYPCMVVRSMEFKGQVDLELIPGIRYSLQSYCKFSSQYALLRYISHAFCVDSIVV